ncbi:MAG: DEAD/DEAH box helicase family protein, partial [Treponema sp.]|nr:DEAD/DEAH box helicase family protein [Treponema sp.]
PAESGTARQKTSKSSLETLSVSDFGSEVRIFIDSQFHIMKDGISERALGAFQRTAVFQNPEYYQAERMRLPLWNKPRYIDCSANDKGELVLPRGSADRILKCLGELDVPYTVSDRRSIGIKQNFSFDGVLREDQQEALSALLEHNTGVLSAGTGFGKTVTATALIARRNTSTLILVHTHALLEQWKNAVMRFLKVEAGTIAAGKDKSTGAIDIALLQSLTDTGKETGETVVKPLPHEYGMVVVDECHHVSAFNFERVLKSIPARCVYGLTAMPVRRDGHQPIIFMQCGLVRYATDMKSMTEQQNFYRHLIPRFTAFKPVGELDESLPIARIYQELAENEARNGMIATDVADAVKEGRTPLVLSERVSHILALAQKLQSAAKNVIVITGRGTQKQKRELLEKLSSVPKDESLVVLATGKYVGEGFDLPRLDTLFLAMPFSWKGTLSQYCGRLHRNYEGKDEVQIYDYIDFRVPMLEKMHQQRLKGYKQLGYIVKPQSEDADGSGSKPGMSQEGTLFSSDDYRQTFLSDCISSKRQVFISSPYLAKAAVQGALSYLRPLVGRGVQVSVMTKKAPTENTTAIDKNKAVIQLLELAGIKVLQKEGLSQRIAVIDEQILWYGSANLLGYAEGDDCFMRICNQSVATAIMMELERD